MLTDDLFLARASCFPQASLVSSVGHLHRGRVMTSDACRLLALDANSIGLSHTGFDFTMHSFFALDIFLLTPC